MSCCTAWRREEAPELHDLYASKLLEPGWAGLLALTEAEYIRRCLERDSKLRRRWGIRRKSVPLSLIATKACPENPMAARRHMAAEQARARRKRPSALKMSPQANLVASAGRARGDIHNPASRGRTASYAQEDKCPSGEGEKNASEVEHESHRTC